MDECVEKNSGFFDGPWSEDEYKTTGAGGDGASAKYLLMCCTAGILLIGFKCLTTKHRAYGEIPPKKQNQLEQTLNQETTPIKNFLLREIEHYQTNIGPELKERLGTTNICKYTPSCSEYAKQAIEKHDPVKGSLMDVSRLGRRNPLSSGGYDPVK